MKVLILTLTVGQGHNSTSFALAQYLEAKGADCTVLDTYKYLSKLIGDTLDKGYSSIARLTPEMNLRIYDKAEKDSSNARQRKTYFPYTFAEVSKKKMQKYIESEMPDVIVCPHIFSAILVTQMKRDGMFTQKIPVIGIITDFTLHPFWEDTVLDYYVVANELMIYTAEKKGISRERILPLGIPVKENFSADIPAAEARSMLRLKDKKTVLMISSTVGFGNVPEILSDLDNTPLDFQIVLICGHNKRLTKKIQDSIFSKDIIVRDYVDNMELYMDASDCVITKPGGITVSETLAKRKPLIITDPLPGVENRNIFFLTNNNLAVHAGKYARIDEVLLQLLSQPERLDQMKKAQELYGKRHSAKAVGDFLIELNNLKIK
jgi:processive 1,2-diacylglycerol beta-glucosyltransferase